MMCHRD